MFVFTSSSTQGQSANAPASHSVKRPRKTSEKGDQSKFTRFAIVGGTGILGRALVRAFALKNLSVLVLTRRGREAYFSFTAYDSVSVAEIPSYRNVSFLSKVLKGREVVINVLGNPETTEEIQLALAQASVQAGVELFVPNDFGIDFDHVRREDALHLHPFQHAKYVFHHTLASLGLPHLSICTGAFPRALPLAALSIDWKEKRVTILGTGAETDKNVAVTSESDVARFMANAFTTLPRKELRCTTLRVVGCRMTLHEIFSQAGFIVVVELDPTPTRRVAESKIDGVATRDSFKAWWALAAVMGVLDIPERDNDKVGLTATALYMSNPIRWLFEEAEKHQ